MERFSFIIEDTFNPIEEQDDEEQSGFADFSFKSKLSRCRVDYHVINENVKNVLSGLAEVFETIDNEKYHVDEIEVTLQVGSQGEVSILSTVSGSINLSSGIKVTIKRKQ